MNQGYMYNYDVVGRTFRPAQGLVLRSPSTGGTLDDLKAWLDKESIQGVPNKYLVGVGVGLGLLWYGHKKRWLRF